MSETSIWTRIRGAAWQGFLRRFLVWLVLAAAGVVSAPVYPAPLWHGWISTALLAAASLWAMAAAMLLWRGDRRGQAALLYCIGLASLWEAKTIVVAILPWQ